jgi:hypothetical protein
MVSRAGLAQTPVTQNVPALQTAPVDDSRTVNALLHEVRLLRIALQTVNTNSKRIQLLAERIRIQQDRADKVAKDIDETRDRITDTRMQLTKLAEIAKEYEIQIRQEQIQLRRIELDRQLRISQLDVPALNLRENRLKEREALLLTQHGAELSRLYELQEKMDVMDREFEADAVAERKANRESSGRKN